MTEHIEPFESSRVRVSSLRIESIMHRWNSGGTTCAETCPLPLRDGAVACGARWRWRWCCSDLPPAALPEPERTVGSARGERIASWPSRSSSVEQTVEQQLRPPNRLLYNPTEYTTSKSRR